MKKKTPEELVDILRKHYGDEKRGSEFPEVLDRVVKAGGYKDAPASEIIEVKKAVVNILVELVA